MFPDFSFQASSQNFQSKSDSINGSNKNRELPLKNQQRLKPWQRLKNSELQKVWEYMQLDDLESMNELTNYLDDP